MSIYITAIAVCIALNFDSIKLERERENSGGAFNPDGPHTIKSVFELNKHEEIGKKKSLFANLCFMP